MSKIFLVIIRNYIILSWLSPHLLLRQSKNTVTSSHTYQPPISESVPNIQYSLHLSFSSRICYLFLHTRSISYSSPAYTKAQLHYCWSFGRFTIKHTTSIVTFQFLLNHLTFQNHSRLGRSSNVSFWKFLEQDFLQVGRPYCHQINSAKGK